MNGYLVKFNKPLALSNALLDENRIEVLHIYNVGRTVIALFGSCHISKGDIILFFYREDSDWCILNDIFSHVSCLCAKLYIFADIQ